MPPVQNVAVELELAPVGSEFRKAVVAGSALLSGLAGIAWQRSHRPDAHNAHHSDPQSGAAASMAHAMTATSFALTSTECSPPDIPGLPMWLVFNLFQINI